MFLVFNIYLLTLKKLLGLTYNKVEHTETVVIMKNVDATYDFIFSKHQCCQ